MHLDTVHLCALAKFQLFFKLPSVETTNILAETRHAPVLWKREPNFCSLANDFDSSAKQRFELGRKRAY